MTKETKYAILTFESKSVELTHNQNFSLNITRSKVLMHRNRKLAKKLKAVR